MMFQPRNRLLTIAAATIVPTVPAIAIAAISRIGVAPVRLVGTGRRRVAGSALSLPGTLALRWIGRSPLLTAELRNGVPWINLRASPALDSLRPPFAEVSAPRLEDVPRRLTIGSFRTLLTSLVILTSLTTRSRSLTIPV